MMKVHDYNESSWPAVARQERWNLLMYCAFQSSCIVFMIFFLRPGLWVDLEIAGFGAICLSVGLSILLPRYLRYSGIRMHEKIVRQGDTFRYFNSQGDCVVEGRIEDVVFVRKEKGMRPRIPTKFTFRREEQSFPVYANISDADELFKAFGLPAPTAEERGGH